MENISLLESFSEFKDEKLIDRVTLMVILEEVFRNSLTRKFGTDENFDIIINPDKGDLEIWRNRIVVKDGEVEDPNAEIEITQARKIEPDFEVGEEVRALFLSMDVNFERSFFYDKNKYFLDLYDAARVVLERLNISSIFGGDRCTYKESNNFFSYRRDGINSGRMAHLIWMK